MRNVLWRHVCNFESENINIKPRISSGRFETKWKEVVACSVIVAIGNANKDLSPCFCVALVDNKMPHRRQGQIIIFIAACVVRRMSAISYELSLPDLMTSE